jgi:hypothetical protein
LTTLQPRGSPAYSSIRTTPFCLKWLDLKPRRINFEQGENEEEKEKKGIENSEWARKGAIELHAINCQIDGGFS